MLVSMLVIPGAALSPAPSASGNEAEHYFYDQLSAGAKKIYDAMWDMYSKGVMQDGRSSYDLTANGAADRETVRRYLNNDRTLFNDFAAAKDAFDLEHPEVWYLDSTYLCLRTADVGGGEYHAYLGPGVRDDYYVSGVKDKTDVLQKTKELDAAVAAIVNGAKNQDFGGLSESDRVVKQVKYVHDQVTKTISYRFETDCAQGNQGYIRTVYALVTHEGVCESYSRSIQLILNRLGIPCVLVHGIQNSGTPEMHMWNLVKIQGSWYAIDATWDDPVKYIKGTGQLAGHDRGLDGRENRTYFLVGAETIAQDWLPSGIVSTSGVEFKYPELALNGYAGENVHDDGTGLHVSYTSMSEMEGAPAGQYKVDFNGKGIEKAAREDGLYLLVRMYDEHQDGTEHSMDDWYYAHAALYLLDHDNASKFLYDSDAGFYLCTPTCEYVEFAMTTRPPDNFEKYSSYKEWGDHELFDSDGEPGFYHGDESDIFAKTDRLYNAESKYEAPPYVLTQTPACNTTHLAGYDYHVEVRWDDVLWHPAGADDEGPVSASKVMQDARAATIAKHADDRTAAAAADGVKVRCVTYQLDKNGNVVESKLSVIPGWDANYDRIVDSVEYHMLPDQCPKKNEPGHHCSVDQGCPFDGVDFNFKPSDQWADDSTMYQFSVVGAVGSRSFRVPNAFDINVVCFGLCPGCYRSQGIDWNLWGMPTLLDNPDDLDLDEVVMQGVDGHTETLKDLQDRMKVDDLNGRITLVVEPIGEGQGDREKYNEVTKALEQMQNQTGLDPDSILESSMYEITFTKLCQMIMLETGQSLRMQVGFPPGFDADSPVVFKAYHFTRDDAGNIISVEEIPVAVTPYGLVILCDSFSPFELVAVDPAGVEQQSGKTVVVSSGEGGSITRADGGDTAGANGMITLKQGQSAKLFVRADSGHLVESVSFDGHEIPVDPSDHSVTISYSDIANQSGIINASFIAASVRQADENKGLTPVIPEKAVTTSSALPQSYQKTLVVGPDADYHGGTADFSTIQQAIDYIYGSTDRTGYTIVVEEGRYGAFTVPSGVDDLVISGSGRLDTTVDLSGSRTGGESILVRANDVTLENLSILTRDDGIYAYGDGLAVEDCEFIGTGWGNAIVLDDYTTVFSVSGSEFSDYEVGISQEDASVATRNISIRNNVFSDCEQAVDLVTNCTSAAGSVTFSNNTVSGSSGYPSEVYLVNVGGYSRANISVSGNWFENTAVVLAGFDSGLMENSRNQFDRDSVFVEAEPNGDDTFTAIFEPPVSGVGEWVMSPYAQAPENLNGYWGYYDFLSYVSDLISYANRRDGRIVFEDLDREDLVEVSRWMMENVYFVEDSSGQFNPLPGSGSETGRYAVNTQTDGHGVLTAIPSTASAGQTVTVTATPYEGYVLSTLTAITSGGRTVQLTQGVNGAYTFLMPDDRVTVAAAFRAVTGTQIPLPFLDVPANAWYANAVGYMYRNGYIAGLSATTFGPAQQTTRAQLVAMLYKIAGSPSFTGLRTFRDVSQGAWYYSAVSWAAENGIVTGFEDGTFRPDTPVTRQELAAILHARAQGNSALSGYPAVADLTKYRDYASIPAWSMPHMQWACAVGIIGGTADGYLNPTSGASRAEVAQILMNYLNLTTGR